MSNDTVNKVKLLAASNVLCKMMYFDKAGEVVVGHTHPYNHATLVSSGSVRVTLISAEGEAKPSKVFKAPTMIYIPEGESHELVALEDNTLCVCIHALRTIDEEIVAPEFLVDCVEDSPEKEIVNNKLVEKYGMPMQSLISPIPPYQPH